MRGTLLLSGFVHDDEFPEADPTHTAPTVIGSYGARGMAWVLG